MKYDFDKIIDRTNTNSLKYDFAAERGMPEDLLPLWVADMDFQAPPQVLEALQQTVSHGIFGYSEHKQDYIDVLHKWFASRFNWDFEDDWLVKTPGIVYAIATAVRAFTSPGDSVIIQQPVYYPFAGVVKANDRRLVVNSLYRASDRENIGHDSSAIAKRSAHEERSLSEGDNDYMIDFKLFEKQIIDNDVKLFIFCSPHNPIGRVWNEAELVKLGEICERHDVLIVSDEIHADFIYPGFKHRSFSSLSAEFADRTILCTAPSKTFNLAGLQAANIFISNDKLRREFKAEINRSGYSQISITGLRAAQAAYEHGADWLDQLQEYLFGNLNWLEQFLVNDLPQVRLVRPQGTYLVWLDFRSILPEDKERKSFMINEAKLWLDEGTMFGPEGSGYERVNIACPRATLEEAMRRLKVALDKRFGR